jgi:hypothetical protein
MRQKGLIQSSQKCAVGRYPESPESTLQLQTNFLLPEEPFLILIFYLSHILLTYIYFAKCWCTAVAFDCTATVGSYRQEWRAIWTQLISCKNKFTYMDLTFFFNLTIYLLFIYSLITFLFTSSFIYYILIWLYIYLYNYIFIPLVVYFLIYLFIFLFIHLFLYYLVA